MTIANIDFGNNLGKPIKKFREAMSKISRVVIIKKLSEVCETKLYAKFSQENSLNAYIPISNCFIHKNC
jgi:7,8-dihydro-6-hydroxymethylpterin-pyrophosphokinase